MRSQSFPFDVTRRPILHIAVAAPGSVTSAAHVGAPALRALVDTGATRSMIASSAARQLGLPPRSQQHLKSVTDTRLVNAYFADVAFKLGEDFVLLPAANLLEFVGDPGTLDAVVGWDLLIHFIVEFNGPQRRFTMTLP